KHRSGRDKHLCHKDGKTYFCCYYSNDWSCHALLFCFFQKYEYFFGKCGVNHIFYVICLLNLLNFSCLVEIVTNMWHFCFIGDLIYNNNMDTEKKRFIDAVSASYNPKGAYIQLGSGLLGDEIISDAKVNLALKIMNRHGLIAGATGTGKTRTLQL